MTALLTLAEAAAELRLSTDSIRRLVAAGQLPVIYPVARRPRLDLHLHRRQTRRFAV